MKKTIVITVFAFIGSLSITHAGCHGQYLYSDSAETSASIESDANSNCCQGDTIWIEDMDTGHFYPHEVALNGSNATC
ncbi:hypothetical protein MM236_07840 [Belliella sp. DSM 107340]|uniref:Secreted protein n=1 Tax=Belliella calami TaxID=2923436 RepID=A0ABS9UMR2_9BACT|nr:hypothetical protein [Belliella calami]MCH7397895.1 hypothetical protein [Belliella calami]